MRVIRYRSKLQKNCVYPGMTKFSLLRIASYFIGTCELSQKTTGYCCLIYETRILGRDQPRENEAFRTSWRIGQQYPLLLKPHEHLRQSQKTFTQLHPSSLPPA